MEKPVNENTPVKQKSRGKKRKRKDSDSSSESELVLPDNVLEVEKSVIASAVKNKLDDVSVKKILKKVVTNDHVLALVKLREEEESSNEKSRLGPKLTRAKMKELMKVSPKAVTPWNLENLELTPIKHIPVKTRPEVKALIAQELPEDEDDEEYEPTHDDVPSDDDQDMESCSDLDSQPRTPATPRSLKASPQVVKDGPFKVPQEISTPTRRKLNLQDEEATIALRTRSKLCLSETPIEHIESSFVPPDELPLPPVDDHLWNDFLNECLNPASVTRNEDDDETDPEYNVAADQDAHEEDEEALESTIIKISKKELNDLVTELFNIIPEGAVEDELTSMANSVLTEHSYSETSSRWEGKQEPVSDEERPVKISDRLKFERGNNTNFSVGKIEPIDEEYDEVEDAARDTLAGKVKEPTQKMPQPNVVRIAVEEKTLGVLPPPSLPANPPLLIKLQPLPTNAVHILVANGPVMLPEQVQILQQQLRQHIQLATSNFLQLFVHPLHWTMGPTYKEYLESLNKLVVANPRSVAKVCNLQPAVELVRTWEKTVSKETPQNKAMVEFIQKESERWRRRSASNSFYVGEFHDIFKRVVANSPVFLYPHLLPPMPYRPIATRRFAYLPSEDELLAIGLDQFWDYVESNPLLYKPKAKVNPRTRYGLTATVELVAKHMFPWLPPKSIMQHIQVTRRNGDKDNPLRKFFENRELTPVKHKLLPFNPSMTLYEQPEHEMPRSWVRYLAKTSKRFRGYLNQRSKFQQPPSGVEVQLGLPVEAPVKKPLHIDFTKEIKCARINPLPKLKPNESDKIDVHIDKQNTATLNFYKLIETSSGPTLVPFTINDNDINTAQKITINNSNGQIVLTNTVDCNKTPISSAVETTTRSNVDAGNAATLAKDIPNIGDDHCKCCILLRKICKSRQTFITDFFRRKNVEDNNCQQCNCKEKKYPKISNRLKILIKRCKKTAQFFHDDIQKKLKDLQEEDIKGSERLKETPSLDVNVDDLDFATAFQLKLLVGSSLARNILIKKRVNTILSNFDLNCHDPLKLARDLEQTFDVEMVEFNKEFMGFLTPVQAEKINKYRDYFIQNCVEGLVKKIEEQVSDKKTRCSILSQVNEFFGGRNWSGCVMCTQLLDHMGAYPELARYTFSLFPHRMRTETCEDNLQDKQQETASMIDREEEAMEQELADDTLTADSQAPVDYEADHSSSGEDNCSEPESECQTQRPLMIKTEVAAIEGNIEKPGLVVSNIKIQLENCDSSDMSMMIMSDDESIKAEPLEWKREEDKLILEILKQHLTPEERQHKTILEIIDEKQILQILEDSLTDKSSRDIRERVLCILKMLVVVESTNHKPQ